MHLQNPALLQTRCYINGGWHETPQQFPVNNPADNTLLADVSDGGANETRRAIAAAKQALTGWKALTVNQRSAVLMRWYQLMMENQDDLATILSSEQGKPLVEAKGEIAYGASYVQWFAEEARRIEGDIIAPPSNDKRLMVIKQPVGVVASITPWNFPNAMLARKAAPALAAGCTFVAKPAAETPLSALALAVLAEQAGIPAGVFNVVCGSDAAAIGGAMTTSKDVAKLSFTGSTKVGKLLLSQCADTVKRTSMELGGNAPFIVFADADLDSAVAGLMASKFRNAGQTCVCTNRVLVEHTVLEPFTQKLIAAMQKLKVGSAFEEGVTIGPLIHASAKEKVARLVDQAVDAGASLLYQAKLDGSIGDNFFPPTLLTKAQPDMAICREEIFGPVIALQSFNEEAEAIAQANNTDAGLAAYFYSQSISRCWRVGETLDYGIVGINEGLISNAMAPFGGVKQSGFGREGSRYGLDDYLEIKYLCLGGLG
ncbi:NAD-dependent succinate-semialdehyde dehydrogenase [Spongiibacter taiwanensis]|uniref:NAD-dependent succinate-semialdehyde dehydrogenase n=1 Tax=Spongiibacter taiwanensis TaxID=1748242 RepID=UPI002034BCA0|nr:NAD-dependent succinate-semialdehyde dehydrogenase [Spongiibacter taiwanensis]USA44506.1 NAD-dependent succinate-semialdehyde dehydrogenase [Spongiibacter taiwanensis]